MIEFNLLGIKIEISPFFFGMISIFLISDINEISKYVLLFSFLHECGHFAVLIFENVVPEKIKLGISGISVSIKNDIYFMKKIAVFSAGFLTNYILSAIYLFCGDKMLSLINIVIGIFTMYPLPSTDGGSILKEIVTLYDKPGIFFAIEIIFEIIFVFIIISAVIITNNYYLISALFYLAVCILNY